MLILSDFNQFFFSRRCITCKLLIDSQLCPQKWFCEACYSSLAFIESACPLCSTATPENAICGTCLTRPPSYDRMISACYYTRQVLQIIYPFKYHHQFYLHKGLSDILISKICLQSLDLPDLICPLPLHNKRLRQRGYNQSQVIVRYISKKLQIPYSQNLIIRTHYTQPQTILNAKQRARAVRNAFAANHVKHINHVALVDDITTTGHTANEASKALKKAGINQVSVWTLAKNQ